MLHHPLARQQMDFRVVASGDQYLAEENYLGAISEYESALALLYQTDTAFIQRIRTAVTEIESRGYLTELERIRTDLERSRESERGAIERSRQQVQELQAESVTEYSIARPFAPTLFPPGVIAINGSSLS